MTNTWSNKNLCFTDKAANTFLSMFIPLSKMIDSPTGVQQVRAKSRGATRGQYASCTKDYDVTELLTADGVKILIHTPKDIRIEEKLPMIIWIHGGGFVMGEADDSYGGDVFARLKAALPDDKKKFIWASIEYRMAPEFPAPAAANDCINASKWLIENPPSSVDPTSVHLAGCSAGANLALVTTAALVKKNCALKSCFLDSPFVNPQCDSPSYSSNSNSFVNSDWLKYCWKVYTGSALTEAQSDVLICPHLVKDALRGFPKTIVCLGTGDQLYDEGLLVVQSLENDGVECKKFVMKASHVMGFVMEPAVAMLAFGEYAGVF